LEKKLTIKMFCITSEICKLISKVLDKYNFEYQSFNISEMSDKNSQEEIINMVNDNPDVIILDKEVDDRFKEKVLSKFSESAIICLPSLDSDGELKISKNVFHISEPFKLSELENIIINITKNKKNKDV